MAVPESALWNGIWTGILVIYSGITGHQYSRIGSLETKIEKSRDHNEKIYVTKDTFEANMEAIQQANLANAKFTDANTRAIENLFNLVDKKEDKKCI